jgi:DHA1 family multidrug resistance protein-like MFS transporter
MAPVSRSSSLTVTVTSAAPSPAHSSTSTILQGEERATLEAELDEARFGACGANDPQDPLPNKKSAPLPFLPKPNTDPKLVTWDGPNDPNNPQNWSFWYKWWLTIVCTVMTLNVYVPPMASTGWTFILSVAHLLLLRRPLLCLLSRENYTSGGK